MIFHSNINISFIVFWSQFNIHNAARRLIANLERMKDGLSLKIKNIHIHLYFIAT